MDSWLITAVVCVAYFLLTRPFVMVLSKASRYEQALWGPGRVVGAILLIGSNLAAGALGVVALAVTLILVIINH